MFADLGDHVLPKLEGLQHIGFIDTGDAFAALLRRLKRDVRNALNFWARVAHGVKRFFAAREMPIGGNPPAPGLAEVNVAGEFPDDQDVQACHQLWLEAGSVGELLVANGGPEVCEKSHVFAQAQNRLLGPQGTVERVIFPVAHCTKQHSVSIHRKL